MSTSSAIEHLRFKKVSGPLDEMELFFKNAFEEYYKNAKLELIRVRKPRFLKIPTISEYLLSTDLLDDCVLKR